MTGFSLEWLALREPIDHRSRNSQIAHELALHFEKADQISVVDLGCGTGSNLRATSPLLPAKQHWMLFDWDACLLEAGDLTLRRWADHARKVGDTLLLHKAGKEISVKLQRANLATDLGQVLQGQVDLVSACALFDLASEDFIARVAQVVASHRAAFYAVLSYNAAQTWRPTHPADAELLAAFQDHQRSDKGLGLASGAAAASHLASQFTTHGYRTIEGTSSWRLGPADAALMQKLERSFADAVAETGKVDAKTLDDWRCIRHTGAQIGHTDILALPRGGWGSVESDRS